MIPKEEQLIALGGVADLICAVPCAEYGIPTDCPVGLAEMTPVLG